MVVRMVLTASICLLPIQQAQQHWDMTLVQMETTGQQTTSL